MARNNFLDLPEAWRDPQEEHERQQCLRFEPDRYAHIWEGEFDDASDKRKVISYELARLCSEAWDRRPETGAFKTSGLDIADTGVDKNALAIRAGPELSHVEEWSGSLQFTISDTIEKR